MMISILYLQIKYNNILMPKLPLLPDHNPKQSGFDAQRAAEETWEALLSAGVFVEGDFVFASGQHATLKADAEKLYSHTKQLETILGHFALHPCVQNADVLLYVPNGMREFVIRLSERLEKPIVHTIRKFGATTKYAFSFNSPSDQELATSAERPLIAEDVVTTLGSVAALRTLLPYDRTVYSLAILLRGEVNPDYQKGLKDDYLSQKEIPFDKDEFKKLLAIDPRYAINIEK
jgi:orotate phosphoribosyltransferase